MKAFTITFFLIIAQNVYSQIDAINYLRKQISIKTDSLLTVYKIDANDIEEFEDFLVLNKFIRNKDSISNGYLNFYNQIRHPENKENDIIDSQKAISILNKFSQLFYPLSRELSILHESFYQKVDENFDEIKLCEIGAASEFTPTVITFSPEVVIGKNLFKEYKIFLISYFGSFDNIEFITLGKPIFFSDTDKPINHENGRHYLNEIGWCRISKFKSSKNMKPIQKPYYSKDDEFTRVIYGDIKIRFIVKADGSTSDFFIVKTSDPVFNKKAIRHIKRIRGWIPAKYLENNVDCLRTERILFYKDVKVKSLKPVANLVDHPASIN